MDKAGPAIILFSHGSRDPRWREAVEAVAARVTLAQPERPVRCAYLELDTPDLASAAADLVAGGARAIRILPMFLGIGRHAREDLPLLVESLRVVHSGVVFELRQAVGEEPRVLEMLARIALE